MILPQLSFSWYLTHCSQPRCYLLIVYQWQALYKLGLHTSKVKMHSGHRQRITEKLTDKSEFITNKWLNCLTCFRLIKMWLDFSHWVSQTESTDKPMLKNLKQGEWVGLDLDFLEIMKTERVKTAWRGGGRYSRMVKSITWEAKQKTGCSYISLFFPIKEDLGMQEA